MIGRYVHLFLSKELVGLGLWRLPIKLTLLFKARDGGCDVGLFPEALLNRLKFR